MHGSPFWGDFARGGISMRSWPLRTVAFLAQAPRDAVTMTPIVSSEATLRLLGCFLSFAPIGETVERNLALAMQLCAEVRSRRGEPDEERVDRGRFSASWRRTSARR